MSIKSFFLTAKGAKNNGFHLRQVILALLIALTSASAVFAQEENAATEPAAIEAAVTETKADDATIIIREQTVYLPFERLRETFEKEGRGIFLPYEEFRELWEKAQAKPKPEDEPKAVPVPFIISETVHEAQVADDIVKVTAKLKIDLLKEGWHEIPLRLNDVAITEATITHFGRGVPSPPPGLTGSSAIQLGTIPASVTSPARLQGDPQQGYKLLLEAEKPGAVEVLLKYAKTIEKAPGRNGVSFEVPQTPISRWVVSIPESGVKVDFFPLIAASEEPDGDTGTKVLAFVGPAPMVRIGWTPKAEGATGLESLTSVQLEQRVTLDEGVLRTQGILDYTISRAQIERLAIEVPNDQKVLSIFDPNVRTWSVNQGEETQTIQVELFQPASERQRIIIGLEKLIDTDDKSVEIPLIKAVGAGRQQGVLGINVSDTLTTDATRTVGLMQMDTAELPQAMRGTGWMYAYRLASASYNLTLSVEKVQPQITSESQIMALLSANHVGISMQTVFTIERAGVFQLLLDIPDGFNILNVTGRQIEDAGAVTVNARHVSDIPDDPTMKRLTVDLTAKAIGKVGLGLSLRKEFDNADLKSPTGNAVDFNIPLPVVAKDFVIRRDAKAVFSTADYLRINKVDLSGMQNIPVDQLQSEWQGSFQATSVSQLGFVFGQENAALDIQVERRKPYITIRQFQLVQIEDGVAKYTSRFHYDIQYSGVRSLRVYVPADVSSRLRNQSQSQGIRDAILAPQPDDVEDGYVAWAFSRGSEWSGNGMFELYWEDELSQLTVGKSLPIGVPRLIPREVDRSYGHIVITKAQTIDLGDSPENTGIRPVDPSRDIPEADRVENAAAAFEFFDNWTLNLIATRYELEEVKRTSIESGLIRAVMVNNSTTLSVQALYQIKSVQQRLTIAMPEGAAFDLAPAINGNTVTLERDSGGDTALHYIPLTQTNPDQSFLLELRYSQPLEKGQILLPTFPTEPAVQEMFIAVYVPNDRVLRKYRGTWTPLFDMVANWSFMNFQRMTAVNTPSVEQLINQMTSITGAHGSSNRPFAVEGQAYLFSTLQPGSSGDAILKVSTAKQSTFYGVIFFGFVAYAIGLTFLRWHQRLAGIAFAAVCLLALGIVNPVASSLLGSFTNGFPAELVYAAWLTFFIWIAMSCVDGVKRCACRKATEPVSEPQPEGCATIPNTE